MKQHLMELHKYSKHNNMLQNHNHITSGATYTSYLLPLPQEQNTQQNRENHLAWQ